MRSFALFNALVLGCITSAARVRQRRKGARVLTPSSGKAYVDALSTTNRFCPVRCASEIVQPSSAKELAEWIRANNKTAFTVKGGGHSYGCQSVPKDGGVMIHTGRLKDARVFRRPNGTAFVRAGTGLTFDELIPRLAKMGYSMPHGECLTVGLGGWSLNLGQHPELKNFDNAWGYGDGNPFLIKATFVDYTGSIFTVDKGGINLVELGQTSRLEWEARALKTKTLAATLAAGAFLANVDIVAVSNIMRIFNMYGASLAIATEFEIELIPKPEPGFFQVTYGISDLLDEAGGRGKQLMQALFDVVAEGGPAPDLDCGIFYASHYFQGSNEGAIALKCADWASPTGASIRRVAPPGFREFGPKASGFLFWTKDSPGKGWVPVWNSENLERFVQAGGVEKYRDYLRKLEQGDESGPNPCDACSSELMYMLKPSTSENVMFDNFCSATQSNQDACSAFVLQIKESFLGGRQAGYKQNLPSCHANPKWKSEVVEYSNGASIISGQLKFSWDRRDQVDFWLGVGHKGNGDLCEAAKVQEAGATCQQHGITSDDLVEAQLNDVRSKCPAWESYDDFDRQNNDCTTYVYNTATPLPVTDL
jgi:hypothetical protein